MIVTEDIYAIKLQRAFRGFMMRNMFRALTRASYQKAWDPALGDYSYYNKTNFKICREKPLLLGNTEWDPDWIPSWSVPRVALFLRRIGLGSYAQIINTLILSTHL